MKQIELEKKISKTMIPEYAKCVFRGITYDVYQWEQEQFDGTYKTFETLKRKPGVQIITIIDNKILLLREEQPHKGKFISVPGGCADFDDEMPLDVAKRELIEETGIEAKEFILWHKQEFGARIEWNSYYYIAKGCSKVCKPKLDCGEKIEEYLVTFEEFVNETQQDDFRNKYLQILIMKMLNNPFELEEFKKMLFNS